MNLHESLERIFRTILDVIRSCIPSSSSVALLDFPNHSNVGDSAIFLGEIDIFSSLGLKVSYICQVENYNKNVLQFCCPNGPILIHGGGNFGDLWPKHQEFRERVIRDFPDRIIIQLPQSVFFSNKKNLERAIDIINSHPNFIFLVRDNSSMKFVKRHFQCQAILCPDMAFVMSKSRLTWFFSQEKYRIVYLSRTDKEALKKAWSNSSGDIWVTDWLGETSPAGSKLYRLTEKMENISSFFWPLAQKLRLLAAESMANARLMRGLKLLSQGKCVITDRLHGMILSLLMKKPTYAFDNSYGKLSSFVDTWLKNVEHLSFCASEQEAIKLALSACV